jgi:hypothetical protein
MQVPGILTSSEIKCNQVDGSISTYCSSGEILGEILFDYSNIKLKRTEQPNYGITHEVDDNDYDLFDD